MFKLEENRRIGCHLSDLIDRKFKSKRQFCIAYIKLDGGMGGNEEISKMANRVSQIIKGTKSIQTYDLPIFTKLLEVTCEEILSAGTFFVPDVNRLTNYNIAFSDDKDLWEQYINREDNLFLNTDEYGKTIIDYALEFKNFEFLKYLMGKGYIWFVDNDYKKYGFGFGAGTSVQQGKITRRDPGFYQVRYYENGILQCKLAENDQFRLRMISLAIENNDFEILTELRAREIPSLYQACFFAGRPADCDSYYNAAMVNHLAHASEEILDYFSQEFVIQDNIKRKNTFLFPYLTDLLDLLIKSKNRYAEIVLKRAITHNQKTFDTLKELVSEAVQSHPAIVYYRKDLPETKQAEEYKKQLRDDITNGIKREIVFYENGNIILFRNTFGKKGIVTNIICANEKSDNPFTNSLIEEMNALYNKIRNFLPQI